MSHKRARPDPVDLEAKYSQDTVDATEERISVSMKYRGKVNAQEPPVLGKWKREGMDGYGPCAAMWRHAGVCGIT